MLGIELTKIAQRDGNDWIIQGKRYHTVLASRHQDGTEGETFLLPCGLLWCHCS